MANKFYITAGLPTKRDGTYVTGTNKAFITAGLIPISVSTSTGWSGKVLGLSIAKINDLEIKEIIGV